eukprot:TRINITY_DN5451_c0_g1_i2.p2 TRINITY_DN5451_c0_g1~~TRINITY_DN5451_c0_g1_i2.p2  ORF type:complete len:128 (+),score=27.93 TRINITY_DN5451_c0_g1_i2:146-529(+)
MLGPKTPQAVQVIHVLILAVFFAWIPFCFQVMPDAVEIQEVLRAEGEKQSDCLARPKTPRELLVQKDAGLGNVALGVEPPKSKSQEQPKGCKHEAGGSRSLSMISFLIALIGGCMFSIEAFEALPML